MVADSSSDQRPPVIQASEILAKIEGGEDVEHDGVIVKGDLDLSGLNLLTAHVDRTWVEKRNGLSEERKIISSPITIINSEIRGYVKFDNAHFKNAIIFKGDEFVGVADFRGAKFTGTYADFRQAEFTGDHADFRGSEFTSIYADFGESEFVEYTDFEGANFEGAKFTGNAYFKGAAIDGPDFEGTKFGGDADFMGTKFTEYACFKGARFVGNAYFYGSKFSDEYPDLENVDFEAAEFGKDAYLGAITFGGEANFMGVKFNGYADFGETKFSEYADFRRTKFSGDVNFWGSKFGGNACFKGAELNGGAYFDHDQFNKDISFEDTKFDQPASQEVACRIAKRKKEDHGNKKDADDYFYREMEAIRLRNGIQGTEKMVWPWKMQVSEWLKLLGSKIWRLTWYDFFEYAFIQGIFGYGVRPLRLFGFWILMVFAFAAFYCCFEAVEGASAWFDYLWFSIATSATPGYALYNPIGNYKIVTGIQAIIGTFMWAAFIATFARKWQR
jgi:uncharacterized protein YjbI with pentapeptide repeats